MAAKKASSFCFWTGIAVGIISAILIFVFAKPISIVAGAADDTLDYTMQYLRIVTVGIPFLILSNTFSNIIRSEGHARTAMVGIPKSRAAS
jgi:Na+-driven multidrug efflux pump